MRFNTGFLMLCHILAAAGTSFAQSNSLYRDRFKEQVVSEEAAGIIEGFLFSPWVTFTLFACIVLVLLGIFLRLYKLVAVSGLIAIIITVFRMFSSQLFGSYSIFQAKVLIPIFLLTLITKLVSDYVNKKKEETREEDEAESKTKHKRRSVDAPAKYKSGGLTRFGDSGEKRSNYEKTVDGSIDTRASSAPVAKLNRSF